MSAFIAGRILRILLAAALAGMPAAALAETVEIVTYYPTTTSNSGTLHTDSLTVGNAYVNAAPGDGVALISNQLGIGTTAPTRDLEVVSTGMDSGGILVSGPAPALYLANAAGNRGVFGVATGDTNFGNGGVLAGDAVLFSRGGNLRFGTTASAGGHPPYVNMSILTNGQVGIGTVNPESEARLQVVGRNGGDSTVLFTAGPPDGGRPASIKVGIGTNQPSQMLDVAGNIRMRGTRSVLFTQGDNATTHVGGIQLLTPNNGALMTLTPTDQNGNPVNSTLTLGGFGNFNSNIVGLGVSGNLGVGRVYAPGIAVPNGAATGNVDANDVFIRSTNRWASQLGTGAIKAMAIYRNVHFSTGSVTVASTAVNHHLGNLVNGTQPVVTMVIPRGVGWGNMTFSATVANATQFVIGADSGGHTNVTLDADLFVLFIDTTALNYNGPP